MATNRGVAYIEPGKVEIQSIPYPKLKMPKSESDPFGGKDAPHGVILKVVTTNICGSDQHMVRGRTTAPKGLILGHEITGEVIEKGNDVEMLNVGDLVTVPFNIACGRCRNCREGKTGICLTVNPSRTGGAYGYVDMGGWVGGQADYVMVPYADFNLIPFPDNDQAMSKINRPSSSSISTWIEAEPIYETRPGRIHVQISIAIRSKERSARKDRNLLASRTTPEGIARLRNP